MRKYLKEMAEILGLLPIPQPPRSIITSRAIINHRDYPAGRYLEAQLGRGKILRYVDCAFTHTDHQTFYIDDSVSNDVLYSGRLHVNLSKMARDGYPSNVVSQFSKEVLFLEQCRVVMDHGTARFIYADPNDRQERLMRVEKYIQRLLRLDVSLNDTP